MSRKLSAPSLQSVVGNDLAQHQPHQFDPLGLLPPEILGLIIKLLDPPDTERLRRVCRSWKAFSEAFNGLGALAQHCPTIHQSLQATGTHAVAESANLLFRRWLCYEENVSAGFVQRVFQYGDVTTWDIRNHVLVSGNYSGRLLIRSLQPGSNSVRPESRQLSLNKILRPFIATEFYFRQAFATVDSDIITYVESKNMGYISRVTAEGKVVWFVKRSCSAIVAGTKYVYTLYWRSRPGWAYRLDRLDITNGVSESSTSVRAPKRAVNAFGTLRLILSGDEMFVAFKCKNYFLSIFQTSPGKLMHIKGEERLQYTSSDACWVSSEPGSSNFSEICWKQGRVSKMFLYTYEVSKKRFLRTEIMSSPQDEYAPRGGIDMGRRLIFEERPHFRGFSYFFVRPLKLSRSNSTKLSCAYDSKPLTISTGEIGRRKPVEFPGRKCHQDRGLETNFFGFYDDYLVFHHVATGRLMIADFRPAW